MDLLTLFNNIEGQPQRALTALKNGMSAKEVAATHIEPHLTQLQDNAHQALDPLYVAYLLEYVVTSSAHGPKNPV